MILRGTLIALGTTENKIAFSANINSPVRGFWKGIEIENNQGGKIIASNIVGEYADRFIEIMSSASGEIINMSDSEISYCNYGLWGNSGNSYYTVVLNNLNAFENLNGYRYASNATITNSVFSNGEKGIMGERGNVSISNTEISFFSIYGTAIRGGAIIDNCNINNNEIGLWWKK